MTTTAVTKLYLKTEQPDGETTSLAFNADYADDRNKEWSRWTPALNLSMNVLNSVAEQFELGATYVLSFEKQEAPVEEEPEELDEEAAVEEEPESEDIIDDEVLEEDSETKA